MSDKKRKYESSFKLEVAKMIVDQGAKVSQVSKNMEISERTLRDWVTQYRCELSGGRGTGKPLTADQQRIRELEHENRDLKQDIHLLKKASAFFARGLK
jgi:transposase